MTLCRTVSPDTVSVPQKRSFKMIIAVTDPECGLGSAFTEEIIRRGHEAADDIGVNLCNLSELRSHFRMIHPDAVIHCRENTDDDIRAVHNLAQVCAGLNAELMIISSSEVYGENCTAAENKHPAPVTAYGRHKFECEKAFVKVWRKGYILRMPDMIFGQGGDMDVVEAILEEGSVSNDFIADHCVRRCGVYAADAAELGVDIIESGMYGIYNCANEGYFTMFGFTCEVFRLARLAGHEGYYDITVSPGKEGGSSVILDCGAVREAGIEPLENWRRALQRCIMSRVTAVR